MGQANIKQEQTVLVPDQYVGVAYCVLRSSGEIDKDHTCSTILHSNRTNTSHFNCGHLGIDTWMYWLSNHAIKQKGTWRVHLQANSEKKHICGWRPINTFWPLELDGQENKITEWRCKLIEILEELELERKKKYPDSQEDEPNQ